MKKLFLVLILSVAPIPFVTVNSLAGVDSEPVILGSSIGAQTFTEDGTTYLHFFIGLEDANGISPTSHHVTVTDPENNSIDLEYSKFHNMSWGHWNRAFYTRKIEKPQSIAGIYKFEVVDGEGLKAFKTDALSESDINPIDEVASLAYDPDRNAIIWTPADGAQIYILRIGLPHSDPDIAFRSIWGKSLLPGSFDPNAEKISVTIPERILVPGATYLYDVLAILENDLPSNRIGWSNMSREHSQFTTPDQIPYETSLSLFRVESRSYEDGREINALKFRIETFSGETFGEDVVAEVKLFDPDNEQVPIVPWQIYAMQASHIQEFFLQGEYDSSGSWNYEDRFYFEPSHRFAVLDELVNGPYRIEVTDARGEKLTRDFIFTKLEEDLPIIPSVSFDWSWDKYNNLKVSWDSPQQSLPEGAFTRVGLYGEFQCPSQYDYLPVCHTCLIIYMPPSREEIYIPSYIFDILRSHTNRLHLNSEISTENIDYVSKSKTIDIGRIPDAILDQDSDGVPDVDDLCPDTTSDEFVDYQGCSIGQYCPCRDTWRNHGQYVSCVSRTAESFMNESLITEKEKDELVSEAAKSDCGMKKN